MNLQIRRAFVLSGAVLMLALHTACGTDPADDDDDPESFLDENTDTEGLDAQAPDSVDPGAMLSAILEGADLEGELLSSPVHTALAPFDRLSVTYRAGAAGALAIQTSPDGTTWSAWTELAGENEDGVYSAELAIEGDAAAYYRLRAIGDAHPSFVSIEVASSADDADSPEDGLMLAPTGDPHIMTQGQALFRRYRFDQGRVTRPWLWLLRTARRHGWDGGLLGSSTGLRTYAQQARLYNLYLSGRGAPAFPPNGPSRHMIRNVKRLGRWAQAVDTQDVGTLISIAKRHGVRLHTPYSNEPWHVEAVHSFRAPRGWRP